MHWAFRSHESRPRFFKAILHRRVVGNAPRQKSRNLHSLRINVSGGKPAASTSLVKRGFDQIEGYWLYQRQPPTPRNNTYPSPGRLTISPSKRKKAPLDSSTLGPRLPVSDVAFCRTRIAQCFQRRRKHAVVRPRCSYSPRSSCRTPEEK
jgi:hypothetical protein